MAILLIFFSLEKKKSFVLVFLNFTAWIFNGALIGQCDKINEKEELPLS